MQRVGIPAIRALALLGVAVAAVAAACGGGGPIDDAQDVTVAERIEFKIPGSLNEVSVIGVDSVVGRWENSDLFVMLDYGPHSDSLGYSSKDGYRQTFKTIGDHEAVIERFMDAEADPSRPYVTAVYFADAGAGMKLTIFGRGATEDDQELLMDVYETLKFSEPDEV